MKLSEYVAQEYGRAAVLARELGIPPILISQWSTGRRPVPMDRCISIERATKRQVTCEELRPDLDEDWAYLRANVGAAA